MGTAREDLTCILNRFLGKITSARFVTTLLVIGTLCWSVDKGLDLLMSASANKDSFLLVKDPIMLLLGAFVSTATAIVTLYFTRTDRATSNGDAEPENGNDPLKK